MCYPWRLWLDANMSIRGYPRIWISFWTTDMFNIHSVIWHMLARNTWLSIGNIDFVHKILDIDDHFGKLECASKHFSDRLKLPNRLEFCFKCPFWNIVSWDIDWGVSNLLSVLGSRTLWEQGKRYSKNWFYSFFFWIFFYLF